MPPNSFFCNPIIITKISVQQFEQLLLANTLAGFKGICFLVIFIAYYEVIGRKKKNLLRHKKIDFQVL